MKKSVGIIGAGLSGLAASAVLAKAGYTVTVFETHKTVGGRSRAYYKDGFTYDMGPSWYLMPEIFENYFSYFGKTSADFYTLKKLNPSYKAIYSHGKEYAITDDIEKTYELFESLEKGAAESLKRYLQKAKEYYDMALSHFLYSQSDNFIDYLKPSSLPKILRMDLHKTYHSHVSGYFSHPDIIKILEYPTVFLGVSPQTTPPVYSMLNYVDLVQGVYYPMGGMIKVVDALYALASEHGVKFSLGQEITQIVVKDAVAQGIKTEKEEYHFDIVLSTADYHFTENTLVPKEYCSYPSSYWDKKVISPSGMVMYLGFDTKIQNVEHHNLYFDDKWDDHFSSIFRKKIWPERPCFYFSVPSKTDTNVSPKGTENVFVFIPVTSGMDVTQERKEYYREYFLTHLETLTKQKLRNHLVVSEMFTQNEFESQYHTFKGSALGMSHTLFQTGVFRPSQKSRKIRNLYHAGQDTQPGIGVPMVLISAQNVAEKIIHETR